jgi:hypothetical protein
MMALDRNNMEARRGFFDVNTPLSRLHELVGSHDERKAMLVQMLEAMKKERRAIHEQMGRPNRNNLKKKFHFSVDRHRHSDLVRQYFAYGDRMQEVVRALEQLRVERKEYAATRAAKPSEAP